jgi:hypothetical protein
MGLLLLMGGQSRPRGILDSFSGAAGAYSVRLLRQAYSGAALRVRRSSDNTETDIGFLDNGDLNTAGLTAFCGAGNGFVTTWYDQTTNGKNAVQASTTAQPQIVSSGSLITEGGKAALQYDGTNDGMLTGITALTVGTNVSVFHVAKTSDAGGVLYWGNNNSRWVWVIQSGSSSTSLSDRFSAVPTIFKNGASQTLSTRGAWHTAFGDGVRHLSSLFGQITVDPWLDFGFGGYTGFEWSGTVQEIILFPSSQTGNQTAIESNINTYFGVY